jgi:hypothetical protein
MRQSTFRTGSIDVLEGHSTPFAPRASAGETFADFINMTNGQGSNPVLVDDAVG